MSDLVCGVGVLLPLAVGRIGVHLHTGKLDVNFGDGGICEISTCRSVLSRVRSTLSPIAHLRG